MNDYVAVPGRCFLVLAAGVARQLSSNSLFIRLFRLSLAMICSPRPKSTIFQISITVRLLALWSAI